MIAFFIFSCLLAGGVYAAGYGAGSRVNRRRLPSGIFEVAGYPLPLPSAPFKKQAFPQYRCPTMILLTRCGSEINYRYSGLDVCPDCGRIEYDYKLLGHNLQYAEAIVKNKLEALQEKALNKLLESS